MSDEVVVVENDKIRALAMNPGTLDDICGHVANGGSLIDKCELWGVPHSRVMSWLSEDKDRSDRYRTAMELKIIYTVDAIMRELQSIALVDIGRAYNDEGGLLSMHEIPEEVRRCIVAVETEELFSGVGKDRQQIGNTKRIKTSDKLKALETLGRRFAMWIDRVKSADKGQSLEELLDESMQENNEQGVG